MFFLLYRQKDIDKIIEGNDRNYVIDINSRVRLWKSIADYRCLELALEL